MVRMRLKKVFLNKERFVKMTFRRKEENWKKKRRKKSNNSPNQHLQKPFKIK
jgi:hypothetical protein